MDLIDLDMRARQQQLAEIDRNEENARKNRDFSQQNNSASPVLAKLGIKNVLALPVYHVLVHLANHNNEVILTREAIADFLEVSKTSISGAIKTLMEHDIIMIKAVGKTRVYCINAEVMWKSYATRKQYATLVKRVSLSDNDAAALKRLKTTIPKLKVHGSHTQIHKETADAE